MLIISDEQMKMFDEYMKEQFVEKVAVYIRETFPEETKKLNKNELLDLVRSGWIRAKEYGLAAEWDVCRFIQYKIRLSPDFDANPEMGWAGEILVDPDFSGKEKMDRIDYHYFYVIKG